jgi:hypothetical protein
MNCTKSKQQEISGEYYQGDNKMNIHCHNQDQESEGAAKVNEVV